MNRDIKNNLPNFNSPLMKNKKGLVMGVANNHSLAWGIADLLHKNGARLAYTYQGDSFKKRVEPLAKKTESDLIFNCDVTNTNEVENVFSSLKDQWGNLDFIVHGIAYSDKNELNGRYLDTTKENFLKTLEVSCYSLTEVTRIAEPYINKGGSILTLSFGGSTKVMPNYNVMGVAKAALESSVRYLASDLGKESIRVNAISAGPMRTLSGAGVGGAREIFNFAEKFSPLNGKLSLDNIGSAGLYLLSDLSLGVTGEIHYVDAGYNKVGMPDPKNIT